MELVYELPVEIQELDDGGDYKYVGTSPVLPNLIVVGDTIDEVVALAPGVARALIQTMRNHNLPVPHLATARQPWQPQVLVSA